MEARSQRICISYLVQESKNLTDQPLRKSSEWAKESERRPKNGSSLHLLSQGRCLDRQNKYSHAPIVNEFVDASARNRIGGADDNDWLQRSAIPR